MKLARYTECTGCQACTNICSKNAVQMKQNTEGFFFPEIDKNLCVDCGKCEAVCPVKSVHTIYSDKKEHSKPKLYAASNKDFATRYSSSSGGIFTLLADEILKMGGVVFGAGYGEDFSICHGFIEDRKDISRFQTSKYVQSYIGDVFRICRTFLNEGRWVLFSGISCQIDGLYQFLGKDYKNLITVDLICSGNTSPGVWKKYLAYMEEKKRAKIFQVNFRDKKYGWDRYCLHICFSSGREYRRIFANDPWAYFFLHHQSLRECCYECPYKDYRHGTDFVLGDFWGVQYTLPELYDDCGLSFVLVNNEKAAELWNRVSESVQKRELPLDMLEKHNMAIVSSASRPSDREAFFEDYKVMNFKELARKYTHIPMWKQSNLLYDRYRRLRGFAGGILRRFRAVLREKAL